MKLILKRALTCLNTDQVNVLDHHPADLPSNQTKAEEDGKTKWSNVVQCSSIISAERQLRANTVRTRFLFVQQIANASQQDLNKNLSEIQIT